VPKAGERPPLIDSFIGPEEVRYSRANIAACAALSTARPLAAQPLSPEPEPELIEPWHSGIGGLTGQQGIMMQAPEPSAGRASKNLTAGSSSSRSFAGRAVESHADVYPRPTGVRSFFERLDSRAVGGQVIATTASGGSLV